MFSRNIEDRVVLDVWNTDGQIHLARYIRPLRLILEILEKEIKAGMVCNTADCVHSNIPQNAQEFDRRCGTQQDYIPHRLH